MNREEISEFKYSTKNRRRAEREVSVRLSKSLREAKRVLCTLSALEGLLPEAGMLGILKFTGDTCGELYKVVKDIEAMSWYADAKYNADRRVRPDLDKIRKQVDEKSKGTRYERFFK